MMTQQLGFNILTAPLAAIDRRALSQAWYSALHLARTSAGAAAPPSPRAACAPRPRTQREDAADARPRGRGAVRFAPGVPASSPRVLGAEQDRRAPRSALARRIERCFLDPARDIRRATFSIEETGARVHVALQCAGNGLRLVAVCPPSACTRVARALEQARYALAARGIALAVDVRGDAAC